MSATTHPKEKPVFPSLNVKTLHVHLHMPTLPSAPVPTDLGELNLSGAANHSTERFIKQNDGTTVLDTTTGLEWTADAISTSSMDWEDAKKAVADAKVAGHTDWRLPTIQELLSLVDYERRDPAINTDFFTCKSSYYWTSTSVASSSGFAWLVHFHDGHSYWASSATRRSCAPCARPVSNWFFG